MFCFLWALARILDILSITGDQIPLGTLVVALLCLAQMCFPQSSRLFLALAFADLISFLIDSPHTPNHAVLRAFIDLGLLAFALVHRRFNILSDAAPLLRSLLLLTYAISLLHKCNHDYLNPTVSCASFMLHGILKRFGLPEAPQALADSSIWGSLACEALIPLLLLTSYRRTALLIAIVFHTFLALHAHPGVYSFSALTLTLISLFWPNGESFSLPGPLRGLAIAASTLGLLLLVMHQSYWANRIGFCLFLIAAAAGAIACALHRSRQPAFAPILSAWRSPAVCLLLLFLANGLAPYLGLHTLRTFAMFSNLRTEGARTNHLWIPTSSQVFPYQNPLIAVIESSDPSLQLVAESFQLITYDKLRRLAAQASPASTITYQRYGIAYQVTAAQIPPLSLGAQKFFDYRILDPGPLSSCKW